MVVKIKYDEEGNPTKCYMRTEEYKKEKEEEKKYGHRCMIFGDAPSELAYPMKT